MLLSHVDVTSWVKPHRVFPQTTGVVSPIFGQEQVSFFLAPQIVVNDRVRPTADRAVIFGGDLSDADSI